MARFGPQERSEFLAIKAACYRGLGSAELLAHLGDRLGRILRADATCMLQLDPATALPVYAVSQGWAEEDHRPLIEHALLRSPAADPGLLVEQRRRAVDVEALIPPDRPYYRDPYFVHHLLPRGYRHELQTVCAAAGRGRALLTVTRRETSGRFEPRHRRFLDALAPHVAAGMHAATVRESLGAPVAPSTGLILLNEQGKVELANAVGERWLSMPDRPGQPGRLWALHVLASLLARSLTPEGAQQVPEITVADPTTGALHRLRAERATAAGAEHRLIILIEPCRWADDPQALLRLGLTPREAEITLGFLRGAAPPTIARENGVSRHTVAQHLRSVFAKLGVSSRHELVARLYQGF